MKSLLKLIGIVCGTLISGSSGAQLPSFLTPCSRSQPSDELSTCITLQSRIAQKRFAKGYPALGIDPLDPLTVKNINAKAGTFTIISTNVIVKGLKKMEITEMKWDLDKLTAHTKLFGNLTFLSDYSTDGRVLLIPITGNGKLSVKMYNTEVVIKYKIRKIKGVDGLEHIDTYDWKSTATYGNVKIHLSNLLGGSIIGDTINQVINENWRDLMAEVGPPFIDAVAERVHEIINKLYYGVPFDELILPQK